MPVRVIGVDAVDHQRAIHPRVGFRRLEDLADGAAAGAPAAQRDAAEMHAGLGLGLLEQRREAAGVLEQLGVGLGNTAHLDADHGHVIARGGHFRQPGRRHERRAGAMDLAVPSIAAGTKSVPNSSFSRRPGGSFLREAEMLAGMLDHRRWILLRAHAGRPARCQVTRGNALHQPFLRAQMAVMAPVQEVDGLADDQPDDQPQPVEIQPSEYIMAKFHTMPRIGTRGTSGVLNGRTGVGVLDAHDPHAAAYDRRKRTACRCWSCGPRW